MKQSPQLATYLSSTYITSSLSVKLVMATALLANETAIALNF